MSENFQYSLCRLTGNQSAVDLTNLHIIWGGRSSPIIIAEWRAMEAHLAHNQENAGSSPVSATQRLKGKLKIKERSVYIMASRLSIEMID